MITVVFFTFALVLFTYCLLGTWYTNDGNLSWYGIIVAPTFDNILGSFRYQKGNGNGKVIISCRLEGSHCDVCLHLKDLFLISSVNFWIILYKIDVGFYAVRIPFISNQILCLFFRTDILAHHPFLTRYIQVYSMKHSNW